MNKYRFIIGWVESEMYEETGVHDQDDLPLIADGNKEGRVSVYEVDSTSMQEALLKGVYEAWKDDFTHMDTTSVLEKWNEEKQVWE